MRSEIRLDMRREFYKIGWSPVRVLAVPKGPLFSLLKKQIECSYIERWHKKATKINKQTYHNFNVQLTPQTIKNCKAEQTNRK